MKLLLAEDQKDLSKALSTILTIKGYEVDAVLDGRAAYEKCLSVDYDGLILDIMMPEMSGLEVLQEIRKLKINTPVLMLTAKAEISDRVAGLDMGADDYLAKPFVMEELLARIHAMLRRQSEYVPKSYAVGNTALDSEGMALSVGANSLRLAGKETQLLALLMNAPGRLISKAQMKERLWKDEEVENDKLTLYISYLQGKLASIHANIFIQEEADGYRLEVRDGS